MIHLKVLPLNTSTLGVRASTCGYQVYTLNPNTCFSILISIPRLSDSTCILNHCLHDKCSSSPHFFVHHCQFPVPHFQVSTSYLPCYILPHCTLGSSKLDSSAALLVSPTVTDCAIVTSILATSMLQVLKCFQPLSPSRSLQHQSISTRALSEV